MTLAVVNHASSINTLAVPGTFNPGFTPTTGNLIVVFLHSNINVSSVTINTTSWTQFVDVNTGGGSPVQLGMGLYRYAQIGDTSTFPALWTAGTSYTAWEIYEISGVSGTFATDHENSTSAFADVGTPVSSLTCSHTTTNANDLCLTGAGQYNGSHNPTLSAGWTLDESANNNGNYGSQASGQQAVASPTAITSTVTYGGTSQPADLMLTTLKLATTTETGTGVLSFGGIALVGAGADRHAGTAALHFGALTLVINGSDITAPTPPTPPTPPTTSRPRVDPLAWNVPIINKDGSPTPEFQRKWDKQNTVNGGVVPQSYIDTQDTAQLTAAKSYTESYGATVLVAAKAYTDSQPPNALPSYTVATLPAAPAAGKMAMVTDATTPTYLGALVGGGAVVTPVFYNGTAWLSY